MSPFTSPIGNTCTLRLRSEVASANQRDLSPDRRVRPSSTIVHIHRVLRHVDRSVLPKLVPVPIVSMEDSEGD